MTARSYFGKMNSTLGSVVPLAMFLSHIDCLCSSNTNEYFFIASHDRSLPSVRFLAKRESGPSFSPDKEDLWSVATSPP